MQHSNGAPTRGRITLDGRWHFRLDPYGLGVRLPLEHDGTGIHLPGSTDEAGKGYATLAPQQHYLTRLHEYTGPAWYQRSVTLPETWRGKRVVLFLERPHWETTVWLGEAYVGRQNSLSVPHAFDLGQPAPGEHTLTIRVDNSMKIAVGDANAQGGQTNLAHSTTDHTQTNWNGIVGRIELQATDPAWIDDLQVYPDPASATARVVATVGNATGAPIAGELTLEAVAENSPTSHAVPPSRLPFAGAGERIVVEATYAMPGAMPWDEFSPVLYALTAGLEAAPVDAAADATSGYVDSYRTRFGMRTFTAKGRRFELNGRPVFLRGTLECCIFPLTGYPPTDVPAWRRILDIARAHGLNHLRFHSYCPPDAAFVAADEAGFMLHVEGPFWAEFGSDPLIDAYAYAEGDRILARYGNHPSFCLMAVSNEPSGPHKDAFFAEILAHWRALDPRHQYTAGAGWPTIAANDFHSTPTPRSYRWGEGLEARFNALPLSTDVDYADFVDGFDVPVVSHEIGQWTAYPGFGQIEKYTGVTRARNLEQFRDSLAENGLLHRAEAFAMASGKLQTLLYKEDIEAALRTPEFGGFQLLDLHDFPGQGSALVGVLDAFWDDKGYVTPEAFREFCGETVPLARMPKVVWQTDEVFQADALIAHFGPAPLTNAVAAWRIEVADGTAIASGRLPAQDVRIGSGISLGRIEAPLRDLPAPSQLVLRLELEGTPFRNRWDLWVYPAAPDVDPGTDVHLSERLDDASVAVLRRGGSVLLLPPNEAIANDVAFGFTTAFWSTAWTGGQPPHTMGLLCDPDHPALASFPTAFHSSWQWWEVTHGRKCLLLDALPAEIEPLVTVIDDWFSNRRLALAFEARVEGGRLLVCSADLRTGLDRRPVARQLLSSLLAYMRRPEFAPTTTLDLAMLRGIVDAAPATVTEP
jgi:hypothetical protein